MLSLRSNPHQSSTWNCCYLYVFFYGNYSRGKEDALLKQIPKAEKDFLLNRNKEVTEVTEMEEGENAEEVSENESTNGEKAVSKKSGRKRGRQENVDERPSKKKKTKMGKKKGPDFLQG